MDCDLPILCTHGDETLDDLASPDLVNRLELMILLKSSVQEDFTFVLEKEWISYMKETFFKLKETVAFIPAMKIPIETIDYYFTQLLEKE